MILATLALWQLGLGPSALAEDNPCYVHYALFGRERTKQEYPPGSRAAELGYSKDSSGALVVPTPATINSKWGLNPKSDIYFLEDKVHTPSASKELYRRRLSKGKVTVQDVHDYSDHVVGMKIVSEKPYWKPTLSRMREVIAVLDDSRIPQDLKHQAVRMDEDLADLLEVTSTKYSLIDRRSPDSALAQREIDAREAEIPALFKRIDDFLEQVRTLKQSPGKLEAALEADQKFASSFSPLVDSRFFKSEARDLKIPVLEWGEVTRTKPNIGYGVSSDLGEFSFRDGKYFTFGFDLRNEYRQLVVRSNSSERYFLFSLGQMIVKFPSIKELALSSLPKADRMILEAAQKAGRSTTEAFRETATYQDLVRHGFQKVEEARPDPSSMKGDWIVRLKRD